MTHIGLTLDFDAPEAVRQFYDLFASLCNFVYLTVSLLFFLQTFRVFLTT